MIEIKESFLTPSYLKDMARHARNYMYHFMPDTSYPGDELVLRKDEHAPNIFDVGQFVSPIMTGSDVANRDGLIYLDPFIFHVYDAFPSITFKRVTRAKYNCLVERPDAPEGSHNRPHEDGNKGVTALFYLHDSDGDTVFFNEISTGKETRPASFTERMRVRPKANTLVLFDSDIYHASSNPRFGGNRYVLNITFTAEGFK